MLGLATNSTHAGIPNPSKSSGIASGGTSSNSAKLRVEIAVPAAAGVIALIVGFFLFRRRYIRKRRAKQNASNWAKPELPAETGIPMDKMGRQIGPAELPGDDLPELEGGEMNPVEMGSNSIHEAGNEFLPHEAASNPLYEKDSPISPVDKPFKASPVSPLERDYKALVKDTEEKPPPDKPVGNWI